MNTIIYGLIFFGTITLGSRTSSCPFLRTWTQVNSWAYWMIAAKMKRRCLRKVGRLTSQDLESRGPNFSRFWETIDDTSWNKRFLIKSWTCVFLKFYFNVKHWKSLFSVVTKLPMGSVCVVRQKGCSYWCPLTIYAGHVSKHQSVQRFSVEGCAKCVWDIATECSTWGFWISTSPAGPLSEVKWWTHGSPC